MCLLRRSLSVESKLRENAINGIRQFLGRGEFLEKKLPTVQNRLFEIKHLAQLWAGIPDARRVERFEEQLDTRRRRLLPAPVRQDKFFFETRTKFPRIRAPTLGQQA